MIKILWNIVKGCKIKFPFLHQNIEFHSILYTQGTFGCWYYKFITLYKNISCQQKRGWWIIKIMCQALVRSKVQCSKISTGPYTKYDSSTIHFHSNLVSIKTQKSTLLIICLELPTQNIWGWGWFLQPQSIDVDVIREDNHNIECLVRRM